MKTKTKKVSLKVKKKVIGDSFVNVPISIPKSQETPKANPFLSSLIEENNKTLTENFAPTFKSTLNSVLDLFAMGSSLRERKEQEIISLFTKAFAEDKLLTLKCLFNIRNCRGGSGERRTFRIILKYLGENYPEVVAKNIENIVEFGRFDDLFVLFETKSEKLVLEFIKKQLDKDCNIYNNNLEI